MVTKNAMPSHNLPCLNVPDEMREMVGYFMLQEVVADQIQLPTGTIGCICCPEVYNHAKFDVLTELNPEIPILFTREYERLMESDGGKRQMTFKMLAEEVAMRKNKRWYAFVSAIILRVDLCKMRDSNSLFCARCECGNVARANRRDGEKVRTEKCMACKADVDLRLNPQILAGLADETGGFCNGDKPEENDHSVLLSDLAWMKLMGVEPDIYQNIFSGAAIFKGFRSKMEAMEEKLLYTRKTFVFCWTGTWAGGRFVIVNVL